MLALKTDDTGEHQVIAPELGGFRQAFELWVCHAQLPEVGLTPEERRLAAVRPLTELPGLRPRVDRLRELSHLTWHWALAPSERQFEGDRYERYEARLSVTDGVWLRPAHRVAGWVQDDGERAMTPVDVIGFYATQQAYRGEVWRFATGDTPDLARQGIDRVLAGVVDEWRHAVAAIDAAQAELTMRLPRATRDRAPEDGWLPETGRIEVELPELQLGARDPRGVERVEVLRDTSVIERVERVEPARGQAVVAWSASAPERPGWRRLLAGTRPRVSAWASRLHWRH